MIRLLLRVLWFNLQAIYFYLSVTLRVVFCSGRRILKPGPQMVSNVDVFMAAHQKTPSKKSLSFAILAPFFTTGERHRIKVHLRLTHTEFYHEQASPRSLPVDV